MKVYLVYWCNNEQWEDYYETVDGVFSTREKAVAHINGRGYKPHKCESEWEKRNMADHFDGPPDEFGDHGSMWVREKEVDA